MIDLAEPVPRILARPLRPRRTLWRDALRRFLGNRLALVGLVTILFLILVGALATVIAPYPPLNMNLLNNRLPPSPQHPFGTDELGRDILSRMIYATRYDLGLTVLTVTIAVMAGLFIGTIAAYWGGLLDIVLMRIVDVLLAFPVFLLGLSLVAFLGPSITNVVVALAVTRLPRYARLIRGLVLSLREREFVEAARVVGTTDFGIVWRHLLPNSLAPIIIYSTLDMGTTITALAGLSFLGVGIQAPTPDWGLMLTTARNNLTIAPWTAIFPGLAICISTMGFNFVGDGLRDALDPRLRR